MLSTAFDSSSIAVVTQSIDNSSKGTPGLPKKSIVGTVEKVI